MIIFAILIAIFLFWFASIVWFVYSFYKSKSTTWPFISVIAFAFLWFTVRVMSSA